MFQDPAFQLPIILALGPPLTVDNAMTALEGVARKWRDVGEQLCIRGNTMDVIALESTSDLQCLRGTLIYWLIHDPLASWRRLIYRFDKSHDADLERIADDCRKFAEKISGL